MQRVRKLTTLGKLPGRYPAPRTAEQSGLYGVGEHCDYGVLTILKQDDVGGLEVKVAGTDGGAPVWIAAPPIPGTFVVNIGDMLDRLTHGRYRATPHRVRNTAGRDRLSVPFFYDPAWDAVVDPIPELRPADGATVMVAGGHGTASTRWDAQDVVAAPARKYGEIITDRISKVFPELFEQAGAKSQL